MYNAFSSWILSVVGVVLIVVVVEMILPSGKVSKFIKTILSLFIVFVFVSPIVTLKNKNYFDEIFNSNNININLEYVKEINQQKIYEYEKRVEETLDYNGYKNIDITINAEISNEIKIYKIYVNICNLVISENLQHIDKYTNIIAIVKNIIDIDEKDIVFNE